MKFTVHCIVKNEDVWIYYALKSVLPHADQIIIFDTGSTDRTVEIIKSMNDPKIEFEEKGVVDRKGLVDFRREQIKKTKNDWFMLLDGDEVWRQDQLFQTIKQIEESRNEIAVINKTRNCLGDVFHYMPENAGGYRIGNKIGNFNMRFIKKTVDLDIVGEYPLEAYVNSKGVLQEQIDKLIITDNWYLHTSFLQRSTLDKNKRSGSLGKAKTPEWGVGMDICELPNVLIKEREKGLVDPLRKRSLSYTLTAVVTTSLLAIKRLIK